MLTIDPELELKLKALAEQEHSSPDEFIKRLINHYIQQKQGAQEAELLINLVNDLPEITCFSHQNPLDTQRKLRGEWN